MADREDKRPTPPEEMDPDAPATPDEIAASQRLRDALEAGSSGASAARDAAPEVDLVASLRSAWSPDAISDEEHRAIVDATPTADEIEAAALLRDALATSEPSAEPEGDALLAAALRAAWAPRELDADAHRVMVDRTLEAMPARAARAEDDHDGEARPAKVVELAARRRATVVRVTFGAVTAGLALAASIFLVLTTGGTRGSEAPLARVRTTQPLFSEPFKPGETSARIDRIASARASDLRDNRFAKWGVK